MMSNSVAERLFDVSSHNPSFFSVKESKLYEGELLDFCIPVNLHFPPPELLELVHQHLSEILRYYPDYANAHQDRISELTGIPPDLIVPTNGSTEIITQLCHSASAPILTSIPTFSRWTDLPTQLGVPLYTIVRRKENEFRLSVEEIVGRAREVKARMLVICNPNNPTGAWLTFDEVKLLVSELANLSTIVIDESFIDFSDLQSASALVEAATNLVVVKSMGKAIGWHGVRLGYAVASVERARRLRDSLPFWNINGLAAYVLKNLKRFQAVYKSSFIRVARDREYMEEQLQSVRSLTVYPSRSNFLYVELPFGCSGKELRNNLLSRHGLMVRECSNKIGSSEEFLRVAVQKREAVDRLVEAMRDEL